MRITIVLPYTDIHPPIQENCFKIQYIPHIYSEHRLFRYMKYTYTWIKCKMPASFFQKEICVSAIVRSNRRKWDRKRIRKQTPNWFIWAVVYLFWEVWCKANVCKKLLRNSSKLCARVSNAACDQAKLVATAKIVRAKKRKNRKWLNCCCCCG